MNFDLESELASASALTQPAGEMLAALGVPRPLICRLNIDGEIGLASVSLRGGHWEPVGPDRRLLLAVRDGLGELIDIAALASHDRNEWALRTGDGWALGIDHWQAACQADEEAQAKDLTARDRARDARLRLRVFATPFDWLAAGGAGICVLEWSAMALTNLRLLGERVTLLVDAGARERMQALLAHGGLPRVETARPSHVRGLAA